MPYQFKTFEEQLAGARNRSYQPAAGMNASGGSLGTPTEGGAVPQPVKPADPTTPTPMGRSPGATQTSSTVPPAAPRPAPLGPGTGTTQSSSSTNATTPTPIGTVPSTTYSSPGPAQGTPQIQVSPYQAPPGQSSFLNSIRQDSAKVAPKLQSVADTFTAAAGPYRNWESVNGAQTIQQAVHPAAGQTAPTDAAKALVGASYAGPTELNQEDLATIQDTLGTLRTRADSLRKAGGVENELQTATTGLTPGELAMESQRIMSDPTYQAEVAAARQGVAGMEGQVAHAQQAATDIAGTRAAQEADIASQAKGLLTGERQTIDDSLAAKIAAENARNDEVAQAYQKFQQSGSLSDLAGLPADALSGWQAGDFSTDATKLLEEAKAVKGGIMNKYQDIADVPLLTLQTTSKGKETIGFPQDWYDQAKGKYSKAEIEQMRQRARARQAELEQAGFASSKEGDFRGALPGTMEGIAGAAYEGGKYGLVDPIYFGDEWKPADARNYTSLDIGGSPARENMATEDQRAVYNRIQDLLGEAEQLGAAGDTYKAATIGANVDKYLADEQAALEERKGNLTQAQSDWAHQVATARKRYRKAQQQGLLGDIGSAIGGVVGLLTGPFAPLAVPALVGAGKVAGEKLA